MLASHGKQVLLALFPPLMGFGRTLRTHIVRLKYIKHHVKIERHCELRNVRLGDYVNITHHCQISDSVIGERSSIGRYAKFRSVSMGKYCSVSWDVTIGAPAHALDNVSTHMFWHLRQFGICDQTERSALETPVIVGNDVWFGCCSIVKSGVTIGDGAVIGANSFVDRDVPPYAIVAGSPAKIIRYRFAPEVRDYLERLAWWNWDDETLSEKIDMFKIPISDVQSEDGLIERFGGVGVR